MIRKLIVIICLSLTITSSAIAQEITEPPTGFFRTADCMFSIPFGETEGETIECGYLTVPVDHETIDEATLELGVAILKSYNDTPAPDPIIMAQGGPGGSTISTYAEQAAFLVEPFRESRDVILFDQRGTLYTKPNLLCPEYTTFVAENIEREMDSEEIIWLETQAMLDCRQRLLNEGINLGAFNSLQNATDVEALRLALGYDEYNFYGVSYGTLLGLHLMRDYPTGLRSVIIDAVVPPQTNFLTEAPRSQNRAFSQLFETCAADPECQQAYPNLENTFFEIVTRLDETPVRVTVNDIRTGESYQAVLDGSGFVALMFQMFYLTDFIPALPLLIDYADQGNFDILGIVWSLVAFDRTMSVGMYNSVICAEDADFTVDDLNVEGIRPQFAEDITTEYQQFIELCNQWDVPDLGPFVDEPVTSDIPTLLFSGQFDPITPPYFADSAAETLTTAYNYVFPTVGHSALGTECANTISRHFLDDPTKEPNSDCLANEPTSPAYLTPNDILQTGLFIDLIQFSINRWFQFGLLIVLMFGLISAWLVWPFTFIMRLAFKKENTQPDSSRSSVSLMFKLVAVLAGGIGTLFVVGFLTAAFMVGYDSEVMLLIGFPSSYRPLFALPWLMAGLTLIMVIGMLMAWLKGYWSILGRLYYSLLTLFALGYLSILGWWVL